MARRKREALDGESPLAPRRAGAVPRGQPTTRLLFHLPDKAALLYRLRSESPLPGALPLGHASRPSRPSRTTMAYLEPDYPAPNVERWFQSLFVSDEPIPRSSAGAPRLPSQASRARHPGWCFATLRIKKDPACSAGYWFNSRCAADVRVRYNGNVQAPGWITPAAMRATYLFLDRQPAEMMGLLVVAPGRGAVLRARERKVTAGRGSGDEVPAR